MRTTRRLHMSSRLFFPANALYRKHCPAWNPERTLLTFLLLFACNLACAVEPDILNPQIEYRDGEYYLDGRKLNFGFEGGELFDTLYANRDSQQMALAARHRYRLGNSIGWPLIGAGFATFLAAESKKRHGHLDTAGFYSAGAGLMLIGGGYRQVHTEHHWQKALSAGDRAV